MAPARSVTRDAHAAPDANPNDPTERERQARAIDALAATYQIPSREYMHAGYPLLPPSTGPHRPVPGPMPMPRDEFDAWKGLYARADALQQESLHSTDLTPKQLAACADLNTTLKVSAAILRQATISKDSAGDHERDALGRDLQRSLGRHEQVLAVYAVRLPAPPRAHQDYWEQRDRESSPAAQREARSERRELHAGEERSPATSGTPRGVAARVSGRAR